MESLIFPLLILLIAVPMFMQARKQKRTMQEQQKLQNSLTVGDRVMTTSGVYGTVVDTAEDTVELELAPGMRTTWLRQAIREKANPESAEDVASDSASADSDSASADSESAEETTVNEESAESESATSGTSESGAQFAEPIENQKSK